MGTDRVTMIQPADEEDRFAPGAGASQVGKVIPFHRENLPSVTATIVATEVVDEGRGLLLTLDVHDA